MDDKVIDSRLSKDGMSIRRRRECVQCEHRFTKACEKRPVSTESLESAASAIVTELEEEFGREIPSRVIGAKVMEHLHGLDEVAYVRYASVYRHFQDIGEFISEIQALERKVKSDATQPELFPGKA
jgi:transcriptional repressor NrdR